MQRPCCCITTKVWCASLYGAASTWEQKLRLASWLLLVMRHCSKLPSSGIQTKGPGSQHMPFKGSIGHNLIHSIISHSCKRFGCDFDVCVLIMTSVSPTFGSLFCLSSCVLHMLAALQSPSVSCKQLYASCDNTALSVSLLCIHAFVQPVSALVSVSC